MFLISLHLVPLFCPTCNIQVMLPSALCLLTLNQYIGVHSVHNKDKNSRPQPQASFGVKLIITITTVRKPISLLTNFSLLINNPRGRVVKAMACISAGCWFESLSSPSFFSFLHIGNAFIVFVSASISILFDTVDSIEILMYRSNLITGALRRASLLYNNQFSLDYFSQLFKKSI